jgi:FMNH2-dependent dimethyl sulfone monooxygenase
MARKKIELTDDPVDPGGQPETRTGEPLELGFFAWNIRGGMTMSKATLRNNDRERDFWKWPNSRRLVEQAEAIGFDYQVPFGRWVGSGGETDFNGAALDFLASAAATAPITSRMGLFSTAHITFKFHPLHIAKFGATIDHISNGRWGLNIVSGYQAQEMAAFGLDPIDHDEAYEMAEEFTVLMKYLWTEPEPFDFEGKYYKSYGAVVNPKPTRRPRPVLMNAGMSTRGLTFGARNVDWVFTLAPDLEGYRAKVDEAHNLAGKFNRSIRAATMSWVLAEATDELAQEKFEELRSEIDREAILGYARQLAGVDRWKDQATDELADDPYAGLGKEFYESYSLGFTSPQLVGSPETIAEKMRALNQEAGLESLLLCFEDPQKGLHAMEDDILPILRKMGLRR